MIYDYVHIKYFIDSSIFNLYEVCIMYMWTDIYPGALGGGCVDVYISFGDNCTLHIFIEEARKSFIELFMIYLCFIYSVIYPGGWCVFLEMLGHRISG